MVPLTSVGMREGRRSQACLQPFVRWLARLGSMLARKDFKRQQQSIRLRLQLTMPSARTRSKRSGLWSPLWCARGDWVLSMESGCVDNRHSPPRLLLSITSEASMASSMKVNDKALTACQVASTIADHLSCRLGASVASPIQAHRKECGLRMGRC